jgi:hypothetical protein
MDYPKPPPNAPSHGLFPCQFCGRHIACVDLPDEEYPAAGMISGYFHGGVLCLGGLRYL